jgi:hypothetical protein
MKHRLFTFLSAVSLALLAATCAMWVRSDRHAFEVSDNTAWTDKGEEVPFDDVSPAALVGEMSEWRLEWLTSQIILRHEIMKFDRPGRFRPYSFMDAGFTLDSHPIYGAYWEDYEGTLAKAEQEILARRGWVLAGFGYSHGYGHRVRKGEGIDIVRQAIVPVWCIAALFFPLPALWVIQRIRAA